MAIVPDARWRQPWQAVPSHERRRRWRVGIRRESLCILFLQTACCCVVQFNANSNTNEEDGERTPLVKVMHDDGSKDRERAFVSSSPSHVGFHAVRDCSRPQQPPLPYQTCISRLEVNIYSIFSGLHMSMNHGSKCDRGITNTVDSPTYDIYTLSIALLLMQTTLESNLGVPRRTTTYLSSAQQGKA